jgi:peptidoglycan-associated lipoprotein
MLRLSSMLSDSHRRRRAIRMRQHSRTLSLALSVLVLVIAVSACHRKPPVAEPTPPPPAPAVTPVPPPAPPPPPPPPPPAPKPLTEEEIFAAKTLDQLNAEAPLADAYFDYDKSAIRPDAESALAKDAQWLLRWRSVKLTVEGHCDERGTAEYNLALGERRAVAVKDYLQSLGVAADRIGTVSYGKEFPVCTEKNETCWQKNRRGHLVIVGK